VVWGDCAEKAGEGVVVSGNRQMLRFCFVDISCV
jgi:hypothetical protein